MGKLLAKFIDEAYKYDTIEDRNRKDGDKPYDRRDTQIDIGDQQCGDTAYEPQRYTQQDQKGFFETVECRVEQQ